MRITHSIRTVGFLILQADKTDYINPQGAIFIDDSNAERLNVKNRLNIPVFSPEMIDVIN